MSKLFPALTDRHREFIAGQPVFFTATAASEGRINLSPKGMDTFRVLDETTVAYLDLTGSGNETAAHLRADGRCTIMFCSFGATPLILRLYGRGQMLRPGAPDWATLRERFPALPGVRQIMRMRVESVQSSCGYAVPRASSMTQRDRLTEWTRNKTPAQLERYRATKNARSIDGLPTGIRDDGAGSDEP